MSDMTIVDFLTARLDEDEAVAREATGAPWMHDTEGGVRSPHVPVKRSTGKWRAKFGGTVVNKPSISNDPGRVLCNAEHIARHDPARVLAEVEAKRRIVRGLEPFGEIDDICAPEILGILAAVYAGHPDYDESWRL